MVVLRVISFEKILRVLWMETDTATLQAKNPVILVRNRGRFERNRCELKILSQWIWDLDILSVLKHVLFFTQYENKIENFKSGL